MKKSLRMLVVEDSEEDTLLLSRELARADFEPVVERVVNARAMTDALDKQPWDVVICDHSIPGFGSLAALKLLQEKTQDIPFVVLSGAHGEEIAVNMLKAGASDYLVKGGLAQIVPAIERALREAEAHRARRRAEEALKRTQQDLEDFFEQAAVGMHWEGPDGTLLRANQAELRMFGYARDEYVGHNIAEFHVDKNKADDLLQRLKRGETLDNFEARLCCKDGSVKDVLISSNVLWEGGNFIHSRSFTRDITELKQAQTALAYLAAIVESSEDAIIGMMLDGTILSWNSGAERIYGYSAAEVKGHSISLLVPDFRPDEMSQVYGRVARGEPIERYETVRVREDGITIDVALTLSPIKDPAGRVVGVSSIERDISDRKREEAERLQLIEELTDALGRIKTLGGLLPICASCKRIRDDHGYWRKVESYISEHTDAEFSHGICPECMKHLYPEYMGRKPEEGAESQ